MWVITYFEDLVELLLFEESIFKVDCDLHVLIRDAQDASTFGIFKVSLTETVHVVEHLAWVLPTDEVHACRICKLTLHEKLGVFAALGSQLNLFLVHWLETRGEVRL